jgi:hypothetical protein
MESATGLGIFFCRVSGETGGSETIACHVARSKYQEGV